MSALPDDAPTPTPVVLAYSGGKDSTLALATLRADPTVRVVGLLTTVSPAYDRVSIHGIRRSILAAQARSLELPVFEATLDAQSSNDAYENAWSVAFERVRQALGDVRHIAYGDLYLSDVRDYREQLSLRMGATPIFPLWGEDTSALAERFVREGYEAYLTCVDTSQLDAAFAGRRFDRSLLDALPRGVDPCGENGEFHTCVVDGPLFRERVMVDVGSRVLRDERFEFCDLTLVQ